MALLFFLRKLFNVGIYVLLLIWGILFIYNLVGELCYPMLLEYREYANVDCVYNFLNGYNSFSLNSPDYSCYVYGPVYPLLCTVLYWPFSIDLLFFMRLMTIVAMFSVALIVYLQIYNIIQIHSWAIVGACCSLMSSWYSGFYCTAFGNEFGVLLIVLSIFLIQRNLGLLNIFVVSILSVLAFFTKQYLIIVTVPIFLYLLIRSYSKAFYYMAITCFLLVIFCAVSTYQFPLYLQATFTHHVALSSFSLEHLFNQIKIFQGQFLILILTIVFVYLYRLYYLGKSKNIMVFLRRFSIYDLSIIVFTFALLKLGGHLGAFMSYFYQLLIVPMLITVIICIHSCLEKYKYLKLPVLYLIVFLCLFRAFGYLDFKIFQGNEVLLNYTNMKKCINGSDNVALLTPLLDNDARKNKWMIFNNGETEYLPTFHSNNSMFTEANTKACLGDKMFRNLKKYIVDQKYNVIVTDNFVSDTFMSDSIISIGYIKNEEYIDKITKAKISIWSRK